MKQFSYIFLPISFHFIVLLIIARGPSLKHTHTQTWTKLKSLSVARLGPWGASQILWVSETRTSIAHANVSRLEFADECNEGQEAEAKARTKRRRYKHTNSHSTVLIQKYFISLLFDEIFPKLLRANFRVLSLFLCFATFLLHLP